MSFNWRLLLAPERVLDYVVWHEVCHLQMLDHSPRFWALLGAAWPELARGPRVAARQRRDAPVLWLSRAARSARSRRSRVAV